MKMKELFATWDVLFSHPLCYFCLVGDTLFVSGCGRFFEGTAEQMHHALMEVLASLPANTVRLCF